MSRTLPTGLATALSSATINPVFLVELEWPGTTLYLWNGYADLAWNSLTWIGTGTLGGISAIKESSDLTANGVVLSLSGIPSAMVAEALRDDAQGSRARIYFGVLTGASFSIDPYLVFDGLLDTCSISDDGTTATINLQLEKEMIDDRSNSRRYTSQDQKLDYPTDLGLDYVSYLANAQFTWGAATVAPVTAGSSDPSDTNIYASID